MKKVFTILLGICLLLSLCACTAKPATTQPQTTAAPETTAAQETAEAPETTAQTLMGIMVVVVHSDGSEKTFGYDTAEEFLGPVLVAEGLIQGNNGPYGLEIITVDGEEAVYDRDKAYWALYEGEEYALQGIDTTPVKDGGLYKLVYTGA